MIVGFEDIFRIAAVLALAGAHMFEHRLAIETPRILVMEPVCDISDCQHAIAAFERHRGDALEIDSSHLFAFAKVADRRLAQRGVDLERHPLTGAASIEAKHQPGPLRRAAVDMGEDARLLRQPRNSALYRRT